MVLSDVSLSASYYACPLDLGRGNFLISGQLEDLVLYAPFFSLVQDIMPVRVCSKMIRGSVNDVSMEMHVGITQVSAETPIQDRNFD